MSIPDDLTVSKKLVNLSRSARDRGLEFSLGFASIKNLLRAKKCYYTGKPLSSVNLTVDRVDNDKGYIKGNVVACDSAFNARKSDLTIKEITQMYKGLKR